MQNTTNNFFYNVNQDDLLNIICCKKNGATKKEIELIFNKFETKINKQFWNKVFNLRKINDYILICKNKKWYSNDIEYYKAIIIHILSNKKSSYLGAGIAIPHWILERVELFKSIFQLSDFS